MVQCSISSIPCCHFLFSLLESLCIPDLPKIHSPAVNVHNQITRNITLNVTPLEIYGRAGILTCSSIAYAFRPQLRTASPWVDLRCPGNLGFTVFGVLTRIFVTYTNIRTSQSSIRPHGSNFVASANAPLPPYY